MCLIFANTKTVYHIAPKAVGKINGHANSPPLSVITNNPRQDANGIDLMERAPHGKLTIVQDKSSKRPDYRHQVNGKPEYYCLKRFMGGFNQQDCYCFMVDPDNDKCLFQTFQGECERGE